MERKIEIVLVLIILSFFITLLLRSQSLLKWQEKYNDKLIKIAEYPGGDAALKKFIKDSCIYPESAQENYIHGTVIVSFIIDTVGKAKDIRIRKSVFYEIDKAVIDVIKKMPLWIPAEVDDKKADSHEFRVPVYFIIK